MMYHTLAKSLIQDKKGERKQFLTNLATLHNRTARNRTKTHEDQYDIL